MAYDLQEQDQLDALRAFWNRWGTPILAVITVVLLAIAGWRGYGWWQQKQSVEASVVHERLRKAVDAKDMASVKQVSGELFEKYPGTIYASMGALLTARAWFEAGDLKAAKAPLQWVIDKSPDPDHRLLARLRLAGVLLDEKAYDEAVKLLSVSDAGAHAGAFADRRGDILLAQTKPAEARSAYKEALDKLQPNSPLRPLVQIKLDALGGV
ncbi:MAG: YfgM family protein [Burkholderiales bacterium]|jgi:predicted negative regulator of RcsB-dependent stress response